MVGVCVVLITLGFGDKVPVYDFKCECGKTNTLTIGLKDIDGFKNKCVCGKFMVRQFGVGAITFKGSGWGKDKN